MKVVGPGDNYVFIKEIHFKISIEGFYIAGESYLD